MEVERVRLPLIERQNTTQHHRLKVLYGPSLDSASGGKPFPSWLDALRFKPLLPFSQPRVQALPHFFAVVDAGRHVLRAEETSATASLRLW